MGLVALALTILLVPFGSLLTAWLRGQFKPKNFSTPMLKGLTVGFGMLTAAYLVMLGDIARKYKGDCPTHLFGGTLGDPCPFSEYFDKEAGLFTLLIGIGTWPFTLGFLLFCLVVGFVVAVTKDLTSKEE